MIATAPAPLVTLDEATHTYTHRDGFRPPSVTQVLSFVPPFAGRFDHVDAERLDYARLRGSQVHRATHYYDEGDLDIATVDPVLMPYLLAWQKFRVETTFAPTIRETAVFHPVYGYAGMLDRIGTTPNGETVLLDIKTGDSLMAGPQTAAYLEAWCSGHADDLPARLRPRHRWTVQLHDTGRYTITIHTDRRDFRVFLAALELYTYAHAKGSH